MKNSFVYKEKTLRFSFITGAILGALCFIGVYGVRVLDCTNIGWLFYGENDLRQHFIAWCHYRKDPWSFPFGLIESLSYPNKTSVIYSDSIPLFAVIFKMFNSILPETFQYFGLFGLLSFMLMGGFSTVLLKRFVKSDIIVLTGSLLYVLSFPVLFRMFYHTALASQWIIIASLVLFVYDDLIKENWKKCLYWGIIGFLCVGIHSYFLPMCGMILAVAMITQYVKGKKVLPFTELLSFVAAGLINMYVLGAFYGNSSGYGAGLGTFSSNLNTFVNPVGMGKILPTLPLYYDFQYEGMAYLGAGVIFLFIVLALGIIIYSKRKIGEAAFHSRKIYANMSLILIAVSIISATFPIVSFGEVKIIHIPYPQIVERILGIFRSNGRLIWVAFYIILTAAISITAYTFRNNTRLCFAVFAAAFLIQLFDMSGTLYEKHEYFTADYSVSTMWDDPHMTEYTEGKDEFVFMFTENNDITLLSAYYGYLHNMRQNNYYFARDIDEEVNKGIEEVFAELESGRVRDGAVYILKEEDYLKRQEILDGLNMRVFAGGGLVILSK